jgi:hypothetical protein
MRSELQEPLKDILARMAAPEAASTKEPRPHK